MIKDLASAMTLTTANVKNGSAKMAREPVLLKTSLASLAQFLGIRIMDKADRTHVEEVV